MQATANPTRPDSGLTNDAIIFYNKYLKINKIQTQLSFPDHQRRSFNLVTLMEGSVNDMTAEKNGVVRMIPAGVVDIQVDTNIAFYRLRQAVAQTRDSLIKRNPLKLNLLKFTIYFSIEIDKAIIIIV